MRHVLAAAVLLPFVSLAAAPERAPPASAPERRLERLSAAERQEKIKTKLVKKTRLRQTLRIAEALDLSDQDALRLSETLARFDGQRSALIERMMSAGLILRRAARGDSQYFGQIDQATQQFVDAKSGLLQLDREVFETISREFKLAPEQRARLALSFGAEHSKPRGGRPHPR